MVNQFDKYETEVFNSIPAHLSKQKLKKYLEKNIQKTLKQSKFKFKFKIITDGIYDLFLPKWKNLFGSRLHVMNNTQLIQNPTSAMTGLENFLGLHSFFSSDLFEKKENEMFYCINRTVYNIKTNINDTNGLDCLGRNKQRSRSSKKSKNTIKAIERLRTFYSKLQF